VLRRAGGADNLERPMAARLKIWQRAR